MSWEPLTPAAASRPIPTEPAWIFGAGQFGRAMASACVENGLKIRGFIETVPTQSELSGLPLKNWEAARREGLDVPVIIGIFNRNTPYDHLADLASSFGFRNLIFPWDLYARLEDSLGWRYWLKSPEWHRDHESELSLAYSLLADETSRNCLRSVVAFRMGCNLRFGSYTHPESQYFNELTLPRFKDGRLSYLDGGAYNGDSYLSLVTKSPVKRAVLFEPDPGGYISLVHTLRSHGESALCLPLALSRGHVSLSFAGGQGEAAHLDPNGDVTITAAAIDDLLNGEEISFIKLDIEGAEIDALIGAEETIKRYHPTLAISAYHRAEDLWTIITLVNSFNHKYRFFMRQHGFNTFELVLYAVPYA